MNTTYAQEVAHRIRVERSESLVRADRGADIVTGLEPQDAEYPVRARGSVGPWRMRTLWPQPRRTPNADPSGRRNHAARPATAGRLWGAGAPDRSAISVAHHERSIRVFCNADRRRGTPTMAQFSRSGSVLRIFPQNAGEFGQHFTWRLARKAVRAYLARVPRAFPAPPASEGVRMSDIRHVLDFLTKKPRSSRARRHLPTIHTLEILL